MEVEKLYPFVIMIVLVGLILGVGIITLDKLGSLTYYTRTGYNDSVAISNFNTSIALDKGNITVISVKNLTNQVTIGSANYTIHATNGTILVYNFSDVDPAMISKSDQLSIVYDYKDYATATRDSAGKVVEELAKIPTDWLGLIITIVILSIILMLVVSNFSGFTRE